MNSRIHTNAFGPPSHPNRLQCYCSELHAHLFNFIYAHLAHICVSVWYCVWRETVLTFVWSLRLRDEVNVRALTVIIGVRTFNCLHRRLCLIQCVFSLILPVVSTPKSMIAASYLLMRISVHTRQMDYWQIQILHQMRCESVLQYKKPRIRFHQHQITQPLVASTPSITPPSPIRVNGIQIEPIMKLLLAVVGVLVCLAQVIHLR